MGEPAARQAASGAVIAVHVLSGSAHIAIAGDDLLMNGGDVVLLPASAVFELRSGVSSELVLVRIPAPAIGPHTRSLQSAFGRVMSTRSGVGNLVAHLLAGLGEQIDGYTSSRPGRLAQHVVSLIALMCSEDDGGPGDCHRPMIDRAKEYIELHLGSMELAPNGIAAALNVSTRTLHRLFEADGQTIGGWIRIRRLEHCRAELSDTALQDEPISVIAGRWGLIEAAHFSRLFKGYYGIAPRDYRTLALAGRLESVRPAERLLARA